MLVQGFSHGEGDRDSESSDSCAETELPPGGSADRLPVRNAGLMRFANTGLASSNAPGCRGDNAATSLRSSSFMFQFARNRSRLLRLQPAVAPHRFLLRRAARRRSTRRPPLVSPHAAPLLAPNRRDCPARSIWQRPVGTDGLRAPPVGQSFAAPSCRGRPQRPPAMMPPISSSGNAFSGSDAVVGTRDIDGGPSLVRDRRRASADARGLGAGCD